MWLNRTDWRGAVAGATLPLIVAALAYGLMFATGIGHDSPAFAKLPFDPSGRISVVIWVVLFSFYGITRWFAWRHGDSGRRAAHLVEALMAWALLYTLIAGALSPFWLDVVNIGSLLFGIFVASQLVRISRFIAAWLVPTFLWKVLAVGLGLAPMLGLVWR
ncbi:tryptophan-rich sensory protein [Terrihabitans rhizophilus]|jgi:tryptophan-rich sensory protein|uniref:Tryptophan-rich sensory protein n=1 Tax=Terrihabitans rhizophilus TaxID=3092662 RepID=A0ABU4RLW6_9HYPH|nr:tryptophan-rich sensory protein [Terrihabitans sp. PJ23]MDX6805213.1 tryptophan-rich sensory protein [Terrihabitans sp. PJ23]